MILRRKIYDRLLKWKALSEGTSAVLVEGARRVGKSTIVVEFAKNEYEDYLILDFAKEAPEIKQNFTDHIGELDTFFRNLFLLKGKSLPKRKSVIIFDEIQLFPPARPASWSVTMAGVCSTSARRPRRCSERSPMRSRAAA